jgi:hypothetical protein
MSKAIVFHKADGPEEPRLEEVALRGPEQGEVRLRVPR